MGIHEITDPTIIFHFGDGSFQLLASYTVKEDCQLIRKLQLGNIV